MTKKNADQDSRKSILIRLRRIEGQVRGVQRMIEAEDECGEIMNQIAAIKSAVNQVGLLVFENHARECIARSLREEDNEQSFDEIVKMMGRFIK
ncbi:MAG TPA: metal-sensitive transcriptional regulator [Syntrophomonas sp.]|jgi:DNA-binding FrmR family transcriptional regulator|nr:metal-sensitive transcriptional regulator [Syntrophomonas sp.]